MKVPNFLKSTFLWNFIFILISIAYFPLLCLALFSGVFELFYSFSYGKISKTLESLSVLFTGLAGILGFFGLWVVRIKHNDFMNGELKKPFVIIIFLFLGFLSVFLNAVYVSHEVFRFKLNDIFSLLYLISMPIVCGLYALQLCRHIYKTHNLAFLSFKKTPIIEE